MFEIGTLDQFADITMGQSPKGTSVSNKGEIPLLNGPTEFGINHPTPVQFTNNPKRFAKKGDLLFCVRGSTGRMNWADQDYAIGRGLAAIRPKDGSSSHFLRGSVQFFLKHLLSGATGSVFTSINKDQLHKMECYLPDENNLKKINQMLGNFSGKIELNLKMNETLEEIAKTLFKSWFIDFDPVKAKAEGRPSGLSKEISDLFPDSFEDSELGEIPKGWKIKDIKDVCNTTDYVANGSFKTLKDNVKRVDSNVKDSAILVRVTDHNSNWNGEFKYIDESSYNFLKKSKLFPGDIVICNVADVGKCFMVPDLGRKMSLGPNGILCKDFKEFETVSKEYFFYFINTPGTQNLLSSISSGSVQNKFNKTQFRSLQMLVPSKKLIQSFDEVCKNIIEMKDLKNKENQILTDLRDTLLPKLISGELRIPDVEKLVEEARV
ncbi:restriction endonuclease subunit S [Gammaproteobacteria bacterium]|nr:restriction endonuclease subunit S [Gammaproteobacteria bacterium]